MIPRRAWVRAWSCAVVAALLAGCVPIGVRVQNMFTAMLG
jgi:hypothetical protein